MVTSERSLFLARSLGKASSFSLGKKCIPKISMQIAISQDGTYSPVFAKNARIVKSHYVTQQKAVINSEPFVFQMVFGLDEMPFSPV